MKIYDLPKNEHGSYIQIQEYNIVGIDRVAIRSRCPKFDKEDPTFIHLDHDMAVALIQKLQALFPERRRADRRGNIGDRGSK